jgi:hypothetical protein
MTNDLEKIKSEILNKVVEQLTSVNELVDDAISVPHLNTKNILLKSIKETVKQAFDKFLVVSHMVKDMNFNEDVKDQYCKSLMQQFGFKDLESTDYDKVHEDAAKKLRKNRPFFTPVSRQDYEAFKLSSDYDDFNDDPVDNKSVNDILEEGMLEYGYKKDADGKWIDTKVSETTSENCETVETKTECNKSTKKSSKRKNRVKLSKNAETKKEEKDSNGK